MAECKYAKKILSDARFMKSCSDADLAYRREHHDTERATNSMYDPPGSLERGMRLIWMRAVRREIAKRLGT